jgi:membrane protein implicated in regulation of membrane protease activity
VSSSLSIVLLISLTVGIICGIFIVLSIYLKRRNTAIDSLVRPQDLIGISGVVEIPFDRHSRGKVRVNVRSSLIDFIALTDDPKGFQIGDQVLVVEMKGNQIWVVSADFTV